MPLDPSIVLGATRPLAPPENPLDTVLKFQQLQTSRENMASLAAEREANTALAQQRIAENQRVLQGRGALVQAIRDGQETDPDTGEVTINDQKVARSLSLAGFPDGAESWLKTRTANAENLDKLETMHRAHGQSVIDNLGAVARNIHSRQDFDSTLGDLATRRLITPQDALQYAAQADREGYEPILARLADQTTEAKKAREEAAKPFTLKADEVRYAGGAPGQAPTVVATGPPKTPTVTLGEFPDYILRWAAEHQRDPKTLTTAEIDQAREKFRLDQRPSVTVVNPAQASNAEAIADAIISGDQPPDLKGMYRYGPEVRAILAKKGYNLTNAQLDYSGAQKHLATLNGAQQTRLRQAVDTATHSLDVIDDLAGQWKGGRFPVLNKINLAAAKNGVYGQQAASIAQQLDAQIADLTSELGNAYMGGNSPTDHALQLAATNLRSDWSEKVLKDMVSLARTNLKIRANAITNVGAVGASPQNQYLPTPTSPAPTGKPTGRFNPATGKVETVP